MERRLTGWLVLAVVAVLVIIVAAVNGRALPGVAVALPVPPPPQPGDCALDDPNVPGGYLGDRPDQLPAVRLAPCTGARYGEVVGLVGDPTTLSLGSGSVPPAHMPCLDLARVYIGVPETSGVQNPYFPALALGVAMTGPNQRQLSAGQRWGACVVYPDLPFTSPGEPYDIVLQGISMRGIEAQSFALCTDTADPQTTVDCGRPHHFELFGTTLGLLPAGISQADLDESCRAIILAATGLPEVTAGGLLTMEAVSYGFLEDGAMLEGRTSGGPTETYAICRVRPTDERRNLTTSIRGISMGRLPLN